jgi:hypothetical protein
VCSALLGRPAAILLASGAIGLTSGCASGSKPKGVAQPPAHRVEVAVAIVGPPNNQFVKVTFDGKAPPPNLAAAKRRFGAPLSLTVDPHFSAQCLAHWREVDGLFTVAYSGASKSCVPDASALSYTATTSAWRTSRGLTVGLALTRLKRLYPAAQARGRRYELVRFFYGAGFWMPALVAEVRRGAVSAWTVTVGVDE